MIGLVGQLAARRLQVAFPRRLPMVWLFNGDRMTIKAKVKAQVTEPIHQPTFSRTGRVVNLHKETIMLFMSEFKFMMITI